MVRIMKDNRSQKIKMVMTRMVTIHYPKDYLRLFILKKMTIRIFLLRRFLCSFSTFLSDIIWSIWYWPYDMHIKLWTIVFRIKISTYNKFMKHRQQKDISIKEEYMYMYRYVTYRMLAKSLKNWWPYFSSKNIFTYNVESISAFQWFFIVYCK